MKTETFYFACTGHGHKALWRDTEPVSNCPVCENPGIQFNYLEAPTPCTD